jgi:hypothetical protein
LIRYTALTVGVVGGFHRADAFNAENSDSVKQKISKKITLFIGLRMDNSSKIDVLYIRTM